MLAGLTTVAALLVVSCLNNSIQAQTTTQQPKLVAEQLNSLAWKYDTIRTEPRQGRYEPPVVTDVSIQPDGNLIAIVGDDHTVNIYDREKESFVRKLLKHGDWIRSAKFSPDGKYLVTAGNDRTIRIWDTKNFGETQLAQLNHAVIEIAFSSDGKRLAAVGFDKTLRVYDFANRLLEQTFTCSDKDIHAVAFSPSGKRIAAAGRDGKVNVWSVKDGKRVSQYKNHSKRIRAITFLGEDKIISCGDDCRVNITDTSNKNQFKTLARHGGKLYSIRMINESTLATAGSDNSVYIWNLENNTQMGVLKGHIGTITCLDSANGILISGSYDTKVFVWNFERIAKLDSALTPIASGKASEKSSKDVLPTPATPATWTPRIK